MTDTHLDQTDHYGSQTVEINCQYVAESTETYSSGLISRPTLPPASSEPNERKIHAKLKCDLSLVHDIQTTKKKKLQQLLYKPKQLHSNQYTLICGLCESSSLF